VREEAVGRDPSQATDRDGAAPSRVNLVRNRGCIRVYLWILVLRRVATSSLPLLYGGDPVVRREALSISRRATPLSHGNLHGGAMLGSILTVVIDRRSIRLRRARGDRDRALTVRAPCSLIWGTHPSLYFVTAFVLGVFLVAYRLRAVQMLRWRFTLTRQHGLISDSCRPWWRGRGAGGGLFGSTHRPLHVRFRSRWVGAGRRGDRARSGAVSACPRPR